MKKHLIIVNACFVGDFNNMVIEWKERGHEVDDHKASQDLECINA